LNLSEFPENFLYQQLTGSCLNFSSIWVDAISLEDKWIIGDQGFGGLTHVRILSFKTFKGGPCDRAFLNV
jgi:hypothetical protein